MATSRGSRDNPYPQSFEAGYLRGTAVSQTLYAFSFDPVSDALPNHAAPSAELSRTISAAGVGDDGWTTYVGFGVASVEVFPEPSGSASTTVFDPPLTVSGAHPPTHFGLHAVLASSQGTIVAGASGFRESVGINLETCTFGADGRGACVVRGALPSVPGGATFTTETFSGSAVPFYALAAATRTTAPPASTSTGASQRKAAAPLSVIAIVLGAALCLL
ncbi:hypothetical protein FB451DRAFT_1556322 [Mycena latifolia]|nr:hypothetical protein FB451DRAFT_1556322 [Mycena latifolia]